MSLADLYLLFLAGIAATAAVWHVTLWIVRAVRRRRPVIVVDLSSLPLRWQRPGGGRN